MPHRLARHRLAESHTRVQALAHQLQRAFGNADAAHAVVDTSGAKAALRDFKTTAFTQQHVAHRYAHIGQAHFHMAVRRVVVAEDAERADDLDARRVGGHQDHGLLLVAAGVGVGLAHDDVDRAARVTGAG